MDYFWLFLGLLLLFSGGDFLVKSVVALSHKFQVKPLFLSLVVFGFMTSSPEWFVSVFAACQYVPDAAVLKWLFSFSDICSNKPALATGNVIGSNIVNLLLVLSLSGLLGATKKIDLQIVKFDLPCLFCFTLLVGALAYLGGSLSFVDGLVCLTVFFAYLAFLIYNSKKPSFQAEKQIETQLKQNDMHLGLALALLFCGFMFLFLGSSVSIKFAVKIAESLSVSEEFVGLFMLSIGTSLPELATCLLIAFKKETDMLIGSVLGSNIFNTLFILGSASLITDLPSSTNFWHYLFSLLVIAALWVTLWVFKTLPIWFCGSAILIYCVFVSKLLQLF